MSNRTFCVPLGIKTTLASAHLAVDPAADDAVSKLDMQLGALFHTHDFLKGWQGEAEGHRGN
jgi:enoyl-CoA hydratase